jgi:dihydrofolate reductase
MLDGTTFHFVTEGINLALAATQAAAGGRDVRIGGGVATIRSYLKARFVAEVHLAIAATALGKGAR